MPERDVDIRKILIVRFSSLGDIVMATAMVRCARSRYPYAQIDMVVRDDFIDLIEENPHLDQKIAFRRRSGLRGLWRLYKQLRKQHYDLVYDAHKSVRSLILTGLLRSPQRASYQKHYLRRALALTFKLPLIRHFDRMLVRYLEPLAPYGIVYDHRGPEIFVPSSCAQPPQHPTVGLIPTAQWPGKRWAPQRFHEVACAIISQTHWNLIVFSGPGDGYCQQIACDLPANRVEHTFGRLSIAQTGVRLKSCDFVIANDTGLMHMADALGVPSILILGPTSREMGCLPFHPASRVIEKTDLWCRPCSKNGQAPCIRLRRHCLEIPTATVLSHAFELAEELGLSGAR